MIKLHQNVGPFFLRDRRRGLWFTLYSSGCEGSQQLVATVTASVGCLVEFWSRIRFDGVEGVRRAEWREVDRKSRRKTNKRSVQAGIARHVQESGTSPDTAAGCIGLISKSINISQLLRERTSERAGSLKREGKKSCGETIWIQSPIDLYTMNVRTARASLLKLQTTPIYPYAPTN